MCNTGEAETLLHKFWDYHETRAVWQVSFFLLKILMPDNNPEPNLEIHWKQALLGEPIPHTSPPTQRFWLLIKGAAMWQLGLR